MSDTWISGSAPIAVVMISLNEGHYMNEVLENLSGWAQEVFLVDSCSSDDTVEIALKHGVHVVQRKFSGFGDQWNFALTQLPITAPFTLKLDPDERLTPELKDELIKATTALHFSSYRIPIRLSFIGKLLPMSLQMVRLWRTGSAKFSDVKANEHALCEGPEGQVKNFILHLDSPHLDHWVRKQNEYTTAEAISQYKESSLSVTPRFFGSKLQRRMWLKANFWKIPGRYFILYYYHLIMLGAWRAGREGAIWARLRTEVYRMWEFKFYEISKTGKTPKKLATSAGDPDPRVRFYQ